MLARFGAFSLDSAQRRLTHGRREVHVTPKAFDLLALLVAEAPRVVRKTELHERLWPGTFVSDATLVGLVKELRRALDDREPATPIIRTAHGVGYAFAAPIDQVPPRLVVSRWVVAGDRRIALQNGENLIGRDPAAIVCLNVPGVSRRHARILVGDDGALLEDLGSKNGTSVKDKPVTGRVRLEDGDRVAVGPTVIVFHVARTGMSTETALSPPPSRSAKT